MNRPEQPKPLRIGEFVADPGLDTLAGPSGEVHLEPKVMEVLLALARRRGETVSQEEILAEVWEGKFVVEAVVTRAVSELRKVFGDDPKAPRYIQTVARRGYRLIAEVTALANEASASAQPAATEVARNAEAARGAAAGARPGQPAGDPSAGGLEISPGPGASAALRSRPAMLLGLLLLVAVVAAGVRWRTGSSRAQVGPDGAPPEAFRLYAQAQSALAGGSCVAHQAISDLERAIALAPTFTEAWEQLGWAKYNLVSSCGESGAAYAEAIRAADRALELAPASRQALALKVAVLVETGRAEEAWALARSRPDEGSQVAFLAAYAATYGGALERARDLLESVAKGDATFFAREGWTPNALLYLGDPDRFLALVPEPATPLLRFYRGYALWRSGRSEAARAELGPAFRERPSDPFARLSEGLFAVIEGRDADARLLLGQLALQRERLAASDGELSFRVAELLAAAGDGERALAEAERAVGQGFFCSRCYVDARPFAALAGTPRFAALVERARVRERDFTTLVRREIADPGATGTPER